MKPDSLVESLKGQALSFHSVVPFNAASDRLLLVDLTESNTALTEEIFSDTQSFSDYLRSLLEAAGATYGIGGYAEHRKIYSRSSVFGPSPPFYERKGEGMAGVKIPPPSGVPEGAEPRRLHLGIDIWGKPNTKVMAPLDGMVHSFAFNNAFGDYGATIILSHRLEEESFFTLYGHLSLASMGNLQEGQSIERGDVFAEFGIPQENGNWPPHLHFQIIKDLQGMKGDYPGVCAFSDKEWYLANCPDPDLILNMMSFAKS